MSEKNLSSKITKTERNANTTDCYAIQNGSEEEKKAAEARLVNRNLGLIKAVALRYSNSCTGVVELDDVEISASIGLLRAAKTYNPEIAEFSTYAVPWMRRQIVRELANTLSMVHLPAYVLELYFKARRKYPEHNGSKFYNALKDDKEFDENEKRAILDAWGMLNVDSLDRPVGDVDEPDASLGDFKASDENVEDKALESITSIELKKLIEQTLSQREAWVVKKRFGLDNEAALTLEECGESFPFGKVTRERIRQIERDAIRKLRRVMNRSHAWAQIDAPQAIPETTEMRMEREGKNLKSVPSKDVEYVKTLPRIKDRAAIQENSKKADCKQQGILPDNVPSNVVIPQRLRDRRARSLSDIQREFNTTKTSLVYATNRYNESRGNAKKEAKKAISYLEKKIQRLEKELASVE